MGGVNPIGNHLDVQVWVSLKQQITLRLDKDIIAWFKARGDRYQTRINEALREYVRQQNERA